MKEGRIRPSLQAPLQQYYPLALRFNEGGSNSTLVGGSRVFGSTAGRRFNEGGSNSTLVAIHPNQRQPDPPCFNEGGSNSTLVVALEAG